MPDPSVRPTSGWARARDVLAWSLSVAASVATIAFFVAIATHAAPLERPVAGSSLSAAIVTGIALLLAVAAGIVAYAWLAERATPPAGRGR